MSIQGCEENCSIDEMSKIVYVKHNVRDEYDELTVSMKISEFVQEILPCFGL